MKLINGDCLEEMKKIPDGSVDAVITDPPYGTTACKWDTVIPFEPMWEELKRITKKNGAIVLFGSQPFTSALVMSNPKMFKYEWVWGKGRGTGFQIVKYKPLVSHENILIFGSGVINYNPQMREREKPRISKNKGTTRQMLISNGKEYMEYLINTYTNEGETVLDFTMGSGTTGVACKNLNRNFIGIELDRTYFDIAQKRIGV